MSHSCLRGWDAGFDAGIRLDLEQRHLRRPLPAGSTRARNRGKTRSAGRGHGNFELAAESKQPGRGYMVWFESTLPCDPFSLTDGNTGRAIEGWEKE